MHCEVHTHSGCTGSLKFQMRMCAGVSRPSVARRWLWLAGSVQAAATTPRLLGTQQMAFTTCGGDGCVCVGGGWGTRVCCIHGAVHASCELCLSTLSIVCMHAMAASTSLMWMQPEPAAKKDPACTPPRPRQDQHTLPVRQHNDKGATYVHTT
jgi:hypothetical protein